MNRHSRTFSPLLFRLYASDLSEAVFELSREAKFKRSSGKTPKPMSIQDLKDALKDIPGSSGLTMSYGGNGTQIIHIGDRQVEVGPMASNDEIRSALSNPFVPTGKTKMSGNPIDRLKEKLAKAAGVGGRVASKIEAKADALIAREGQLEAKVDQAFAGHEAIADAASSELDSIEAALNQLTNGGPPLE